MTRAFFTCTKIIPLLGLILVVTPILAFLTTTNTHAAPWVNTEWNNGGNTHADVTKETNFVDSKPRTILINAGSTATYPRLYGNHTQGGRAHADLVNNYNFKFALRRNGILKWNVSLDPGHTLFTDFGDFHMPTGRFCHPDSTGTYQYCGNFEFRPKHSAINSLYWLPATDEVEISVTTQNGGYSSTVKIVITRYDSSTTWNSGFGEFSSGGPTNKLSQSGKINTSYNHNEIDLKVTEEWVNGNSTTHQLTKTSTSWRNQQFTLGEFVVNTASNCQSNDFHGVLLNCYNFTFRINNHIHSLLGSLKYHIEISKADAEYSEVRGATLTLNGQSHNLVHVGIQVENGTPLTLTEEADLVLNYRIFATKKPTQDLPVKVLISETGDFLSIEEKEEKTVIISSDTFFTVFPVKVENDSIDEAHGTVTATIIADSSYGINQHLTSSTPIEIQDDDVPEITISPHPLTDPNVLELPVSYALFRVTANTPTFERLEITYEFSGNDQFRDTRITHPSVIIIEAGNSTGTLAIKTSYNPNSNASGPIRVILTENPNKPNSYSLPNALEDKSSAVTVTNNNDSIVLSLLTDNFNVVENVVGGNFVINLELSRVAKVQTVFSVSLSGGTAIKGLDYEEPILSENNINIGDDSNSITIPILNDDKFEGNETFILKLSDLVGANFVNSVTEHIQEITIIDSEIPTLSFAESSITVAEEDIDKNIQLSLNLTGTIDRAVDIFYTLTEETANVNADFIDISNGIVSILENTTTVPIHIQIKGDDLSEGNETFKVRVTSPPVNAVFPLGVAVLEATVTIYDDEPIIMSVATADFKVAENVVNGNFIVDVELTRPVGTTSSNALTPDSVSFLVSTSDDGTATENEDFIVPESPSTQLRFLIPLDSKTFSFAVPILNDVENEGNETFNLKIHDLQQATFADGTDEYPLELTILDNEKTTLTFMQDTKVVEEEDSDINVELILNLSGPIDEVVEIAYEVIAESATEGTDFVDNGTGFVSITANTKSIPISIQIKGDDLNEGNETFKVRVKTPSSNAVFADGVLTLEATITITDDESPTLSIDSSTLTISEHAEMTQIGLTLSGPTNEDVIITYSTSITGSDTAQQADFTAQTANTSTIPTSSTPSIFGLIQIPITNDSDEEENETFTLTLTRISGAVFSDDQSSIVVQVTIIDDEGLPTLSIDSIEIAVNEHSGYAEIGLSFTPAITEPVTIVYSTIQSSAVGGVDFTMFTNVTIEIPTGSKETIFIPIINDNIYEGEEEFFMEISAISGAAYDSGVIKTPIQITITDDETEPTITISAYSCDYGEPILTNFAVSESVVNLIFNAKLSHPSQTPIIFNYSATVDSQIQADSATNADFYVSSATQYSIQPGSICTEIVTPITHDELFEEDEQFNVAFTADTGTNITPAFIVKIEDDDIAIWRIVDLTMNEGDSNTEMPFRVYLSTPAYKDVRAKWTASTKVGNTAKFGEDYAPGHNSYTGHITISAGEIDGYIDGLETTGDTIFEPNETFTVFLSDPEDGTQIGDGIAIGTIINDDPEPMLSISTISQVNGN